MQNQAFLSQKVVTCGVSGIPRRGRANEYLAGSTGRDDGTCAFVGDQRTQFIGVADIAARSARIGRALDSRARGVGAAPDRLRRSGPLWRSPAQVLHEDIGADQEHPGREEQEKDDVVGQTASNEQYKR